MKFNEKLRAVRKSRSMSQAELADKTGLQPSAISHFECGTREPSLKNFFKLVKALGVFADKLIPDPIR